MSTVPVTPIYKLNLVPFDRRQYQDLVNDNMSSIEAILAQFVTVNNIVGTWMNSTMYTVGDVLVDVVSSKLYKCLVSHTSSRLPAIFSDDRVLHPTYWELYSFEAVNRGAWATASDYHVNDWVVSGYQYAVCIKDHASTAFASDVTAGDWVVVADLTGAVTAAAASAASAVAAAVYIAGLPISYPVWGGAAGGTANAITLTPNPAITSYTSGQEINFTVTGPNTGATTVNVSGLGNVSIKTYTGNVLVGGEIRPGIITAVFDGSAYRLQGTIGGLLQDASTHSGLITANVGMSAANTQINLSGSSLIGPLTLIGGVTVNSDVSMSSGKSIKSVSGSDLSLVPATGSHVSTAAPVVGPIPIQKTFSGGVSLDLSAGDFFFGTCTGNTTISVVGTLSSSALQGFQVEITSGSVGTFTWPASFKHSGGVAPTLSAGKDLLAVESRDGSLTWLVFQQGFLFA